MKKTSSYIMTSCMLLLFIPAQLKAEKETEASKVTMTNSNAVETAEINAKLDRLIEIKEMDLSTLSRSEKKELKEEVIAIKSDMESRGVNQYDEGYHHHHHGVYITVGGGLLLLLLILLLL